MKKRIGSLCMCLALVLSLLPVGVLAEELPEAKHIFSHVEWHMRGIRIRLTAPVQAPADGGMGELIFADKGELWTRYPLPGAFAAYRRLV